MGNGGYIIDLSNTYYIYSHFLDLSCFLAILILMYSFHKVDVFPFIAVHIKFYMKKYYRKNNSKTMSLYVLQFCSDLFHCSLFI